MPTFLYSALDAAGSPRTGEVVFGSRLAAIQSLTQLGLILVEIREQGGRTSPSDWRDPFRKLNWRRGRKLTHRQQLFLSETLAALLRAGLLVDRGLQVAAALAPNSASKSLIEAILRSVRSGHTLAQALKSEAQGFPPYFLSMVEAGEMGGALPEALTRLAELLRRQLEARERIRSALFYPAILAAVVLLTFAVMLAFVLPRFEGLFAESEAPLPISTRVVMATGRWIADEWWILLAGAAALVAAGTAWSRTSGGRSLIDRWLLRTRLTLGLPRAINTARLLQTVSALCRSGAPLPTALKIACGTIENTYLAAAAQGVIAAVQSGESLSNSLAATRIFPTVAIQLTRVGEETGHLDEMLQSAATILEKESQVQLERLVALIAPVATIVCGVVIAGLISSVLLGLLSLNDVAY
jgi:general secretion pathway protein F